MLERGLVLGFVNVLFPQAAKAAFVTLAEGFSPTAVRPAAKAAGYVYEARLRGLGMRKLFFYES